MIKSIKVTIIMPAYNSEAYIVESMKSVLTQTYDNFELIIINDGSTDRTEEIVRSFMSDKRIRLISQENQGVSVARNTGLKNAQGEYISFLDSDDLYYPTFLQTLVALMEEKRADFVFADFSESYGLTAMQSKDLHWRKRKALYWVRRKLLGIRLMTVDSKIDDLRMHINSVMIRKSLIEKYNLHFLQGVWMFEDHEFLHCAFMAATRAYGVWQYLMHYRHHEGSVSLSKHKNKEYERNLDLRIEELKFARKYSLNDEIVHRFHRFGIYRGMRELMKKHKYKVAWKYVKNYRNELDLFSSTGQRLKDRLGCKLYMRLLPFLADR